MSNDEEWGNEHEKVFISYFPYSVDLMFDDWNDQSYERGASQGEPQGKDD